MMVVLTFAAWWGLHPAASPELQAAFAVPPKQNPGRFRAEPILPLPIPPAEFAAEVMLGKRLFHDRRLSHDNSIACASCHDISSGGDDGLPQSIGIAGHVGKLNAPTVLNCSLSVAQFWDGRAYSLEKQVEGPVHNPIEMGSNWKEIVEKLSRDAKLVAEFKSVFGAEISADLVVSAIVAYEKALITPNSPFDRYLLGDESGMSADALQGYELFKSIGCISCHQGRAVGANMFQEFGVLRDFHAQFPGDKPTHQGRKNVTRRDEDQHRFKVPGLRNVELTAPYFHDGSASTLEQAIQIMAEFQLGETLKVEEIHCIHEFLLSLTGVLPRDLQ